MVDAPMLQVKRALKVKHLSDLSGLHTNPDNR
jgi:hypothetical protein